MENWKRNLLVCWFGVLATSTGLSQIIPILPLYIEQLGVSPGDIERWSGLTYGVTFIFMAIFSPIWGEAADRYGRKPMLLRASLGMAIIVACMGLVQNVYQLLGLRLVQGTVSGFYAASITLIATQTPRERSGWALGMLSTAAVAGMLLGPLLGGYLAEVIGISNVFYFIGFLLSFAFLASLRFVHEQFTPPANRTLSFHQVWVRIPNPGALIALFVTTLVMQLALMSIQPIITVYIAELVDKNTPHIAFISGVAFSASGFASVLAAPSLGKLSDRVGPPKVMLVALLAAGLLFVPQAVVNSPWELTGLRFLLGIATAGLLPSINALVKQLTPDEIVGRVYGYNQSAQFVGSFLGAVMGGGVAAAFGVRYVFYVTGALLLLNAIWVYKTIFAGKGSAAGKTIR